MAVRNDLSREQDDRLAREFPGTLDPTAEGLLPKLATAVVLALLLAVASGLASGQPERNEVERIASPGTETPPAILIEGRQRRHFAEEPRR